MPSHPTNATRRNHVRTFFNCSFHKNHKNQYIKIFFPQKGALTDAGDGRGQQITTNHKNKHKKTISTKLVHTSGHFQKMKNNFKISSCIEKMTPNPIHALKIILYLKTKIQTCISKNINITEKF